MAASDYFNKYLNVEASAHYPAVFMNNIKINTRHVYQPNEILAVDVFHSDMSLSTVAALEFPKSYAHITLSCSQNNESHLAEICDLAIRAQGEKELAPPEIQDYTALFWLLTYGQLPSQRINISLLMIRCRTDFADIQNKKECRGNRQWQNHYLRNWAANTSGKGIT